MTDNLRTFGDINANPSKPGDGGSRGGKSGHSYSTGGAPENNAVAHAARAGERLLSVLLDRVSGWLIAYAYGGYAKTVSAAAVARADRMALAAYCQCLVPLPVEFTAPCDDVPSARLLDAFGLLAVGSMSSVRLGDGRLAVVDASTCERDRATADMSESQLFPSLGIGSRYTAAQLRRDIIADAGERRRSILSNGATPREVVCSVASIAGDRWPDVAAMLLEPDRLPASAHADGKAVADGR